MSLSLLYIFLFLVVIVPVIITVIVIAVIVVLVIFYGCCGCYQYCLLLSIFHLLLLLLLLLVFCAVVGGVAKASNFPIGGLNSPPGFLLNPTFAYSSSLSPSRFCQTNEACAARQFFRRRGPPQQQMCGGRDGRSPSTSRPVPCMSSQPGKSTLCNHNCSLFGSSVVFPHPHRSVDSVKEYEIETGFVENQGTLPH